MRLNSFIGVLLVCFGVAIGALLLSGFILPDDHFETVFTPTDNVPNRFVPLPDTAKYIAVFIGPDQYDGFVRYTNANGKRVYQKLDITRSGGGAIMLVRGSRMTRSVFRDHIDTYKNTLTISSYRDSIRVITEVDSLIARLYRDSIRLNLLKDIE